MPRILPMTLCLAAAIVGRAAYPADSVDGYLCCNAFSDGQEISDLNASGADRHRVPIGSPVHVASVGKHKLKVDIENKKQQIVNDYSREISMQEFLKRWVVTGDPSARIKTFPKNVQLAIADGRLIRGMTREQTLMSLGYPTADDVANLSSKSWLYWLTDPEGRRYAASSRHSLGCRWRNGVTSEAQ
jgi:hypothetical protein